MWRDKESASHFRNFSNIGDFAAELNLHAKVDRLDALQQKTGAQIGALLRSVLKKPFRGALS